MAKIYPQTEILENVFSVAIDISDMELDVNKIEKNIGYNEGEIPNYFSSIIKEVFNEIPKRCKLNAGYVIETSQFKNDNRKQLRIGEKDFHTDIIVTSQLKGSERIAIFLCTIGDGMELWAKELQDEGDILKGYLVNNIASLLAEEITNLLHDHIKLILKSVNLNTTNRYSPGYCNWSVAEQNKIFSFFPQNFCDVKLSESNLMSPIKSVSGIIGIGENVEYKEYLCNTCGIKDCTLRVYLTKKLKKSQNRIEN